MANEETSLKKPRSVGQFRLRTLLGLMAACCLALGWKAEAAFRQQQAVAAIVARGGRVGYEQDGQSRGNLSRAIMGWGVSRDFFDRVSSVYWAGAALEDADLEPLKRLPRLSTVCLASTRISDDGLERLAACPRLELVDVRFTQVTRAGVERLRQKLPKAKVLQWNDGE
jgi:hypothetical protein